MYTSWYLVGTRLDKSVYGSWLVSRLNGHDRIVFRSQQQTTHCVVYRICAVSFDFEYYNRLGLKRKYFSLLL